MHPKDAVLLNNLLVKQKALEVSERSRISIKTCLHSDDASSLRVTMPLISDLIIITCRYILHFIRSLSLNAEQTELQHVNCICDSSK